MKKEKGRMNRKILATLLIMSIIVMLLPAIVSVSSTGIPNPNTITYTTTGGPGPSGGTDPAWAYDTASCRMLEQVYEPLCMYNNTSITSFIPMLADYWPGYGVNPGNWITPSPPNIHAPAGTEETWYFHIRSDVQWQDSAYGNVTTYDVVYSIQRGMLQDAGTGVQWLLYMPLTGAGYNNSLDVMFHPANGTVPKSSFENYLLPWIRGAVQCNSTWVWFNLPSSYPSFMQILTQSWAFVTCKKWDIAQGCWNVGAYNATSCRFAGDDNYTEFIRCWRPAMSPLMEPAVISSSWPMMGSGPYIMKTFNPDPNVGFQAFEYNPNYWQGWPAPGAGSFAQYCTIKIVQEWSNRKVQFLSTNPALQCDLTDVPTTNAAELTTNGSINGPVLPGLSLTKYNEMEADYVFFTYKVSSQSNFMPLLGTNPCPTLFSDRDLRLAFMYAFNATQFLQQYLLGEAFTPTTFMCSGTRFYNSSSTFLRNINLVKAQHYLDLAWGGQVYAKGISVDLVYDTGNLARQAIADMIANVLTTGLTWGADATVNIVPTAVPFGNVISNMSARNLPVFQSGWLADYPDASDWASPFMSPEGAYAACQALTYGLNATSLKEDWPSPADYGPPPYVGSTGRWVSQINNSYVDYLIDFAAYASNASAASKTYNELMDIFYAEAATLPTEQPIAMHFERDWIQGWIGGYSNNPIAVGPYFYQMWKGAPYGGSVYLNPSRVSGVAGQMVNVTLEVSNVAGLCAFQAGCTFNPLAAHCLAVFDGGFLGSLGGIETVTSGFIDNEQGEVVYSYALNGTSKAPSGSGRLMIFEFQMVATGYSDVHIIDWIPIGVDGNEIPTTTIDYSTTSKGIVQIAGNPEGSGGAGIKWLEVQSVSTSINGTLYNGNMSFTVYSPDANSPDNNNYGFLNVTIPKTLMTCNSSSQWYVSLNGVAQGTREMVVSENATDTSISLYFIYPYTLELPAEPPNGLEQVEILSVYYWGTGQYQAEVSTTGKNVTVSPSTCAQVTFTNVTATGALKMNVTQPSSNATELSSAANSVFVSFQTNATYHGNVTLQFRYDPAGLTLADQMAMRIWLWNTTSNAWRDITTRVNTTTDTVYGVSPHLSCFGMTCTLNSMSNGQPIQTIMQTPSAPPAGLPASLEALAYYNITSTPQYTKPVTIQLVYNSSAITQQQAMFLQMWLWNTTSSKWVAIPTRVDTADCMVIGVSPHLSCFGMTSLHSFPEGIAVPSAACSKTVVGRGYNVTISVQVQNQGNSAQNFTAYVYANGTAIYSEQVSNLPPKGNTTVTFNFTANLAYGNYSISACDQPIKWVRVTIPGDLNGDGTVDLTDFGILQRAWGSSPGMSNWDPRADLNGDGVVDLSDFGIMQMNWGATLP
jgi:peptide/nickel transport system substrate-binding protein